MATPPSSRGSPPAPPDTSADATSTTTTTSTTATTTTTAPASTPTSTTTLSTAPTTAVIPAPAIAATEDDEATASLLAQASTTYSDHDSDNSDERSPNSSQKLASQKSDPGAEPVDASCVVCFEREPNVTLDPCGHSNLCDVCVSRLVKRRCPTCRARAKKVTIRHAGRHVTKAVREVIAERKQRETRVLEDTLQIVFLGPEKVGKKTLVRKLIAKYPLVSTNHSSSSPDDDDADMTATSAQAATAASADVFSDGTDFSPNATIAGINVRLTVLRRTTLASRRMVLDDVRVLKPDVLVLCCSAHFGATFDSILAWDKVLRNNFQKPRVWALLTLDDVDAPSTAAFDAPHDVSGAINAIFPSELRPKGHYFCSLGEMFSVGFRSLAKDVVSSGRLARDEELAASIALEEARTLVDQEAAGTLEDHVAANLVIANNGIDVPSSSTTSTTTPRTPATGRPGGGHVGRGFSLRGLRDRGGNGQGISLSGLVSWLAGSHES